MSKKVDLQSQSDKHGVCAEVSGRTRGSVDGGDRRERLRARPRDSDIMLGFPAGEQEAQGWAPGSLTRWWYTQQAKGEGEIPAQPLEETYSLALARRLGTSELSQEAAVWYPAFCLSLISKCHQLCLLYYTQCLQHRLPGSTF